MNGKKVLFISGSLGLGHVVRDLAIAGELRRHVPGIEILWLASHPVDEFLKAHGEKMADGAEYYANDNISAENVARSGHLNLISYSVQVPKEWLRNVHVFTEINRREHFDLIIGDETYEIAIAIRVYPALKKAPFVMIYDFIGLDAMSGNPLEKFGVYVWNLIWWYTGSKSGVYDLSLFVGEIEDVPDRPFGLLLPSRRVWASQRLAFLGQIVRFDPAILMDRAAVRKKLGYGPEPLIVCAVGGTAVGKSMLELFGKTYPILKQQLPGLRMLLVCGPRISPDVVNAPEGVEKAGFIPDLYNYFAACDLALIMAGGSSTLELTVLRRPFIYFPLQGHCEQELSVAARAERCRAGVRMNFGETTPDRLAMMVMTYLGKEVRYQPVRIGGEVRAASLITPLLRR